jgi:hypothetical protein
VPWFIPVFYALFASGLLLAVVAVPLAARGAAPAAWRVHAGLALLLAGGLAALAHVEVYGAFVPWWRIALGYLALVSAPVLAAGWSARAAAPRWPRRRWVAAGLAVGAALVVVPALGFGAARWLLPDVVTARSD